MEMPGMPVEAIATYANMFKAKMPAEAKKDVKHTKPMTVAEFRNKTNHITHYYDNYTFDSFVSDKSISSKDKFAAIYGNAIVDAIYYDNDDVNLDMLTKLMKIVIDNAKETK